jgi:hypothetical protein
MTQDRTAHKHNKTITDRLVGTWKLLSYEATGPDGRVSYPLGQNPFGYLMYTDDGFMSGSLMAANRTLVGATREGLSKPSSVDEMLSPRHRDMTLRFLSAATNYVSYCGRFEVVGDKIIHYVEMDLIPDSNGSVRERIFDLVDDKLILSIPPMGGMTSSLVWQRVGAATPAAK